MGKNKRDMSNDDSEIEIIHPEESTVEDYDMKLENMKEEIKNLKKIRRRQKKLDELEFEQKEILKKMDKNNRRNK
ncbi:hypothetical protein [Clostridium lacusfryxellense]|uniref:hypothetical protein n=1 Tax=Clostridium lacusfryxellense TaxID=205328 RepID=UPI001C0E8827|nr:hypothetical protein [Clostridium lacusfryxellense]MBU3111573.1 hypothetical protein [Clostridium lacusfryxellense]